MENLCEMKNDDEQYDDSAYPLRRRRRTRTVFTSESISLMEEQFNRNRYPDILRREYLAEQIGVSEARVQVWFQNRRARSNKQNGHLPDDVRNEFKQEAGEVHNSGSKTHIKHHSRDFNKCKPKLDHNGVPSANRITSDAAVRAYINQHQMYFPYKHVTPYLRNPFMAYLPINHFSRVPSVNLKTPSLLNYTENKITYSNDREEEEVREDNIVERLFRFSSPSYQESASKANKAKDLKHKYHGISRFKYSVTSMPIEAEEDNDGYEDEYESPQRMPEQRDPFPTDFFKDDSAPTSRAESSEGSEGSETSDFGSVSN